MDRPKLLVVDDDRDLLRGLSIRLKASGFEILQAVDGVQAVAMVVKHKPDLVLLDLGLPAGDGYVVLNRLRSLPSSSTIPIIVLSARDPATDRQKALDAGAAVYLHKPVDNDQLLSTIQTTLS
jgi:DNA-binding response OmpR family regulator